LPRFGNRLTTGESVIKRGGFFVHRGIPRHAHADDNSSQYNRKCVTYKIQLINLNYLN